jgi:hypothetical protein
MIYEPIQPEKPATPVRELGVFTDFLDRKKCERLAAYANWCPCMPAPVSDPGADGNVGIAQSEVFVADRIEFFTVPAMHQECIPIIEVIFRNLISQHYGVEMEWYEYPHILRYHKGGNYRHHSDADKWDPVKKSWERVIDRDFSVILYLNSDFTGGALAFPHLNLRLLPRAGMLVVFPSDHRFVHHAEPTLSGTRYALVTWGAQRGGLRVMNRLPNKIVRL